MHILTHSTQDGHSLQMDQQRQEHGLGMQKPDQKMSFESQLLNTKCEYTVLPKLFATLVHLKRGSWVWVCARKLRQGHWALMTSIL